MRGSAWIAGLHCKNEIQRLVMFKSETTRFRALKTVPERSVRSVLLLNVGVPTRRHAILGTLRRGLVLSIGWAGRQLEKNELRLLQRCKLGLKQALEVYPMVFHQCKPAQGERDDAPAMWQQTALPSHWHKVTEPPRGSGPWQTIRIRANQRLRIIRLCN